MACRGLKGLIMTTSTMYDDLMADPTASDWLKTSFETGLRRDPVDAANDAETLASMLAEVADTVARASTAIAWARHPVQLGEFTDV